MGMYWSFPSGWWLVLGILYGGLFLVYYSRKNKKKTDMVVSIKTGLITLVLGFLMELVGVSLKLWTLFPGNWPITVWVSYFGLGLLGYQIFKKLEEINK